MSYKQIAGSNFCSNWLKISGSKNVNLKINFHSNFSFFVPYESAKLNNLFELHSYLAARQPGAELPVSAAGSSLPIGKDNLYMNTDLTGGGWAGGGDFEMQQ